MFMKAGSFLRIGVFRGDVFSRIFGKVVGGGIVPELNDLCRQSPPVFAHGGVMLACGVYILVSQNIGNKINVARFAVEHGAVRLRSL